MAKMTLEFDTVDKTFKAMIDGKEVPNAMGAHVHPSWDDDDEWCCEIVTKATDPGTGITEVRRLCASTTTPTFAESVSATTRAQRDIAAAFGCKE